jgi:hypothetical protein
MGQHSIGELFAALTRLPVQPRIHPVEAARIVTENILPYFEVVSLGKEDYLEALNTMASGGWSGAKIYDALQLRCGEQGARWSGFTPSISETSGNWPRPVCKRKSARHDPARNAKRVRAKVAKSVVVHDQRSSAGSAAVKSPVRPLQRDGRKLNGTKKPRPA